MQTLVEKYFSKRKIENPFSGNGVFLFSEKSKHLLTNIYPFISTLRVDFYSSYPLLYGCDNVCFKHKEKDLLDNYCLLYDFEDSKRIVQFAFVAAYIKNSISPHIKQLRSYFKFQEKLSLRDQILDVYDSELVERFLIVIFSLEHYKSLILAEYSKNSVYPIKNYYVKVVTHEKIVDENLPRGDDELKKYLLPKLEIFRYYISPESSLKSILDIINENLKKSIDRRNYIEIKEI